MSVRSSTGVLGRGTPRVPPASGGGADLEVLDEGVSLGNFDKMNFIGAGVSAVDAGGGQVNVTIPGGVAGTDTTELLWGNQEIAVTTAARFLYPTYSATLAPTFPFVYRNYKAGTIRNLRVRHNLAGTGSALLTYTLLVNGVASALSASIAADDATLNAEDLVNSVAVAAGDLLSLRVTKAAAITASPLGIILSAEWFL